MPNDSTSLLRGGRPPIRALAAALALLPIGALAAPIQLTVTGTVASTNIVNVAAGDASTFILLFDPADITPNSSSTPATANHGLNGATVDVVLGSVAIPNSAFSSDRRIALFDDSLANPRPTNTLLFNDGGGTLNAWGFSFESRGPQSMLASAVPPLRAADYQAIVAAATTRSVSLFNCADLGCETLQRASLTIVSWNFVDVAAPVPVPATLGLMLAGLAGLSLARRRGRETVDARVT